MVLKIGIIDGENTSQYTGSFSGSFTGSGNLQTLQQVTDKGSITTNAITASALLITGSANPLTPRTNPVIKTEVTAKSGKSGFIESGSIEILPVGTVLDGGHVLKINGTSSLSLKDFRTSAKSPRGEYVLEVFRDENWKNINYGIGTPNSNQLQTFNSEVQFLKNAFSDNTLNGRLNLGSLPGAVSVGVGKNGIGNEKNQIIVTTSSKSPGHRYYGKGDNFAYYFNDNESPWVNFYPDQSYKFTIIGKASSTAGFKPVGDHPFAFFLDPEGTLPYTGSGTGANKTVKFNLETATNTTYTNYSNSFAQSVENSVEITCSAGTPSILYYQDASSTNSYVGNAAFLIGATGSITGSSGEPGGVTKSIQFNENDTFSGSAQFLITSSLRGTTLPNQSVLLASGSANSSEIPSNVIETQGSIDIVQGDLKVSGYNTKEILPPYFSALTFHPVSGGNVFGAGEGGVYIGRSEQYSSTAKGAGYSGTGLVTRTQIYDYEDYDTFFTIFQVPTSSFMGAVVDYSFVSPVPGLINNRDFLDNGGYKNHQYGWTGTSQCIWPHDTPFFQPSSPNIPVSSIYSTIKYTNTTTENLYENQQYRFNYPKSFSHADIRWILETFSPSTGPSSTVAKFQFKPNSVAYTETGKGEIKSSYVYFNATCKFLGGSATNMAGFDLSYIP